MSRTFYVPHSVGPQRVEGFPAGCERSVKGSIFVRPQSSVSLTEGEVEHLKSTRPELMEKLRDITPAPPRPAPVVKPPPDNSPPDDPPPGGSSEGDSFKGKGKGRGKGGRRSGGSPGTD